MDRYTLVINSSQLLYDVTSIKATLTSYWLRLLFEHKRHEEVPLRDNHHVIRMLHYHAVYCLYNHCTKHCAARIVLIHRIRGIQFTINLPLSHRYIIMTILHIESMATSEAKYTIDQRSLFILQCEHHDQRRKHVHRSRHCHACTDERYLIFKTSN